MLSKIFLLAAVVAFGYVEGSGIIDAIHHPQPYKFGYSIKDHHGEQHREESGNGAGAVAGSYGFTDDRGIARKVNYVADHAGFRAQVKTNEPGTANQNPAAVKMISNDPYAQGAAVPYVSVPNSGYVAGAVLADPVTGLGHGYGYAGPKHGLGYGYAGPKHGLGYGYAGPKHGLGYGYAGLGHDLGYGYAGQGLAHGAGLGYGYGGALGYSGLLGSYGGMVNYGAPLVGGAIRGFDSRFVNLP